MSLVEEWLENRSPIVGAISVFVAMSADDVSESLFEMSRQADTMIPQPELSQWLGFYTSPQGIIEHLGKFFTLEGVGTLFDDTDKLTPVQIGRLRHVYLQPETLFFLKVWGPSVLHYGASPRTLFLRAKAGRLSSFEKLLRLDNSVIFDEELSQRFHQHKSKRDKSAYRKLLFAFSNPVIGEKKRPESVKRHVKSFVSGFISHMSGLLGEKLTAPQVRELFDAIAVDRGNGLQDEDLPLRSETFSQAVRRYSKSFELGPGSPYKT